MGEKGLEKVWAVSHPCHRHAAARNFASLGPFLSARHDSLAYNRYDCTSYPCDLNIRPPMHALVPPATDPKLMLACALASIVATAFAVRANWHTSLLHTACWALAAACVWCLAALLEANVVSTASPWTWIVFAATAAPIVAVLGARRPTVLAWNFVVVGFLATLLFPVLSNQMIGSELATPFQFFFLGTTLAVGVINYLPTRLMPAALLYAVGCTGLLLHDAARKFTLTPDFHASCVLLSPVVAWAILRRNADDDSFDDYWLRFRDRFGWLWAQRAREQFNHAAQNAGWQVRLGWRGLVGGQAATDEQRADWFRTLRAVLKRFMDDRG